MHLIPISDIIVPDNRQRREFAQEKLDELARSITEIGLLQPIVLKNDGRTIVCGERRMRALSSLSTQYIHDGLPVDPGFAPFVTLSELSAELVYAAELEENVQRVDLTWQERTRAIAELHKLRVKQHGVYSSSNTDGQSIKSTASEILGREARGSEISRVSDAISLADFLDDPLIAAARDEKEAKKIIREELQHKDRLERASKFNASESPHKLTLGSCYDAPAELSGLLDVIVTDPPYGINIHKKEMFDGVERHEYDDSDVAFGRVLEELPQLARRLCKPDAHIYVFCDIRRFPELFTAFEIGGWTVWPRPLIWDKGNTGSYGNMEYGFRAVYDAVVYARIGDRKVTGGYRDVISISQPTNLPHPAGKPVELYADLLRRSVRPGDKVGDFFCGSGPIFDAATQLKCQAYGWELNPKYHAISVSRLAGELKRPARSGPVEPVTDLDDIPF
jgi:ParB/RepB/Spo0J family partition protein